MSFTIRGGLVPEPGTWRLRQRDVVVDDDGVIDAVQDAYGTSDDRERAGDITAEGMLVVPGFVDTHRHTWQTAMRGLAFGWDLRRYQTEFQMTTAPAFTPEDVYIGTLLGALTALDSGITTLRDESHVQNSWAHTEAAVAALRESGIRACFGYGWPSSEAYMKNSGLPHPADMERARGELLAGDDGLVTMYAHLRGPGMSGPDTYKADLARARALGLRASIHAGSAPRSAGQNGDVGWMHGEGLLGDDITLVHCGRCTPEEYRMMADTRTHVSVTAALEQAMPGLGAPAYADMRLAGLLPSLGIDVEVAASGNMFDVMRAVAATHQLRVSLDPRFAEKHAFPSAAELLTAATAAGANACGLGRRAGTVEEGKDADLVLVNLEAVNTFSDGRQLETVVAHGHPGNVDTVLVRGQVRKRHGRLVDVDPGKLHQLLRGSWDRHPATTGS